MYTKLKYVVIYPVASGIFSAIAIIIPWTINNQDTSSKRGTGIAILNLVGQCGPLLGTRLYPETDAPRYRRGMAACAGSMACVGGLCLWLRWLLARENQRRRVGAEIVRGGSNESGGVYEMLNMGEEEEERRIGGSGASWRKQKGGGLRFIL